MGSSSSSPDDINFERIIQEPGNRLPMFLFVCFIVLGVFMFQTSAAERPLTTSEQSLLVDIDHLSKALVPAYPAAEDSCLA
jgi:hypothetical protein